MIKFFSLKICGLTRELPIKPISKNTSLANFNILGDVELIQAITKKLAPKLKDFDFDYLVGPEVKVVPLIHELSLELNKETYVICRKSVKPYMVKPIKLKPLSHFPKHTKQLVLDGKDANLLKNKRVAIVDDVVSTGVTMRMIDELMERVGAKVILHAAAIRQSKNQFDEIKNFIYLTELPIFKNSSS